MKWAKRLILSNHHSRVDISEVIPAPRAFDSHSECRPYKYDLIVISGGLGGIATAKDLV